MAQHLALVRVTPLAEVDVISAQLCSFASAIFPWLAFSWSDCSLSLIIVVNSPNMHNTGFFLDCLLLSVSNGFIWMLYLARYSEILKIPNFWGSKMEDYIHLKKNSRRNRKKSDQVGHQNSTIFGLLPTPRFMTVFCISRFPDHHMMIWSLTKYFLYYF